ncbi:HD domain-containing protein [Photobacterium phosphoreum]|jgi:(p)ppGpp synthase/HD superfamily hydrolase|uniref:HD domain-containing protein n=1 Tax=Photobacterium phosphoreum TaxID=659 RepID=A0A2T3JU10_PHOPO|nr:HD domain-containing protein [Photobacterium phosphoreum]KJF88266.1 phosphohydrolase [Photobacterium phosphoreum]MCD9463185.1 HD domain-containing protein [Photobacterium phosphoreum]MCD9470520.1 HD domain-containing protein [Photobacterium phosphoreum]MCD9474269.1 HD domain-containing protein [Photobacterium phosphoreum]MCD9479312.1 HD domain-containing protein [Photobacterium phosphoreum]
MDSRYLAAQAFAKDRHGDQKYGELPYAVHLNTVAKLAQPFGVDAMIVAQLHDVIEDTDTSFNELADCFGFTIADAVNYVTDVKLEDRAKRKLEINQRLAALNVEEDAARLALIVKVCDRLSNVRSSSTSSPRHYKMYQHEHSAFKEAVYRPGLCDDLWIELNALIIGQPEAMLCK